MRNIFLAFFLLVFANNFFCQKLDGFKYVYIYELEYEDGSIDKYSLVSIVKDYFTDLGLKIISGNQFIKENNNNPCDIIFCELSHTTEEHPKNTTKIDLSNCNNNIVLTSSATDLIWLYYWENSIRNSTKKALKNLKIKSYNFDESRTPKSDMPVVEKTNETEESLIEYFDNNRIDDIEGIYKSYSSEDNYYKFGIKKYGYKYKAIIIESNLSYWKVGEVKVIFEPSSVKGVYSAKYYTSDKIEYETFAKLENNAMLQIKFSDDEEWNFVKLYPSNIAQSNSSNNKTSGQNWKGNGSGIIISKSGHIITNHHVIENTSDIEVEFILDDEVQKFNAEILQVDKVNDLAIIKIVDVNFDGVKELPYNFKTRSSDVGTKVYAYGYPMALSLMGKEIKITDGIISSKSGFDGDITTYQITAPIQGGNSGGPLFDDKGNFLGINSSGIRKDIADNVAYTIKSNYVLNLIDVLPKSIDLPSNTKLQSLPLTEQIKEITKYVVLIKVK